MHKYLFRYPESRNAKRMEEIRTTNKHDLERFYTNKYKSRLLYFFDNTIRNIKHVYKEKKGIAYGNFIK